MTSVEIPYSIAAALPTLAVLDITNDVSREIAASGISSGIVYVSAGPDCLIRVNERESGFFLDLEQMLARLVPLETSERVRLLTFLLGPRTEQVPFVEGRLCLGQWQRIMLIGFDESCRGEWMLTLVG